MKAIDELIETQLMDVAPARAELEEWRERFGLVAGITERGGGPAPFSLGLSSESDPTRDVVARFESFRAVMRPAFAALQMGRQVHATTVAWHKHLAPGWHVMDGVDGHATAQPGLLLAVTVADCVPVYLATRDGTAFALVHAGWRGVAGGVLQSGVRALREHAKVLPADLVMHCGVAICGACYEVGPEVARAVLGAAAKPRTQYLDLRAVLAGQAQALGVGEVSVSPLCTSCHQDRFFSHRASRGASGRQLAYLGRPQELAAPASRRQRRE